MTLVMKILPLSCSLAFLFFCFGIDCSRALSFLSLVFGEISLQHSKMHSKR